MLKSVYHLGDFEDESGPEEPWRIHPHEAWGGAVFIRGTADEINARNDLVYTDYVAGIPVHGSSRGKHDGQPAVVLNLGSGGRIAFADNREVEWVRDFGDDPDGIVHMNDFLQAFERRVNPPPFVKITVDLVTGEDEDRDQLIAEWAADYGVSFHLLQEHGPGGGNPVFQLTGLADKVEAFLRGPYKCDDDAVRYLMYGEE